MVSRVHSLIVQPVSLRATLGDNLTVVYTAENEAFRKKTRPPAALLPLLVILFLVSYGILAMLVFEQGQTIESQRSLIREMLKDSTQLASMKDKLSHDDAGRQQDDKASVQGEGSAVKAGVPEAAAKGSNVKGPAKEAKKSGKTARSMKQVPGKPEADLQDVRRSTRVI